MEKIYSSTIRVIIDIMLIYMDLPRGSQQAEMLYIIMMVMGICCTSRKEGVVLAFSSYLHNLDSP